MAKFYKIHPTIGVARLGSSPAGWFIGPETPGQLPNLSDPEVSQPANGKYKDGVGSIKRQAARFRIYEYSDDNGPPQVVREITDQEAEITWGVALANRKAFGPKIFQKGNRNSGVAETRLIIDAPKQSVQGRNQPFKRLKGSFQGTHSQAAEVPLGDLFTDAAGRLLVLGGFGKSFSPANKPLGSDIFNNDDWCDDSSDGPVTASFQFRDTWVTIPEAQVEGAWVIVGPPDYAPPIGSVITLYDIVYDAATKPPHNIQYDPDLAAGKRSFVKHIFPILRRAVDVFWVEHESWAVQILPNGQQRGHAPQLGGNFLSPAQYSLLRDNNPDPLSPSRRARQRVFNRLRRVTANGTIVGNMPKLQPELDSGREPRLTDYQIRLMEEWVNGNLEPGPVDVQSIPPAGPLSALPVAERPFALDKAALDACVGASFYPGIEAPRILREDPSVYRAPFRIGVQAGMVTRGLALPWQTDFFACQIGWWPAQRPNSVVRNGQRKMWEEGVTSEVDHWKFLGFVVPATAGNVPFVENERDPF